MSCHWYIQQPLDSVATRSKVQMLPTGNSGRARVQSLYFSRTSGSIWTLWQNFRQHLDQHLDIVAGAKTVQKDWELYGKQSLLNARGGRTSTASAVMCRTMTTMIIMMMMRSCALVMMRLLKDIDMFG